MKTSKEYGELIFRGAHFNVYRKSIEMADGVVRQFETATCADVVRVYPVDEENNILLIREYNYTLDTDILRTVSGQIDDSETMEQAAQRELQEEIGLAANHLELFATSRPIIKVDCTVYHYLARDLRSSQKSVHEGELIEVVKSPLNSIPTLINERRIPEDIIALNLLRLYQKLIDANINTR